MIELLAQLNTSTYLGPNYIFMEILIISNLFQIVAQLHSDQVLKFQHVSVLCLEEPLRRDEKFQILITKQKLPSTLQRLQMPSGVSLSLQVTMILRFSSKRLKGRFEGTCSCVTFWVRSGDAAEIFLRSSSISGPHPTATLAPKLPDSGGKCISFQSFDPKLTKKITAVSVTCCDSVLRCSFCWQTHI